MPDIQEFDLNPTVAPRPKNRTLFTVYMFMNGDVESVHPVLYAPCTESLYHDFPLQNSYKTMHRGFRNDKTYYIRASVWARDKKHAIKIVNEKRAQMIALGYQHADQYKETEEISSVSFS